MKHIISCIAAAVRHPATAALGAREFRSGVGMTYDHQARSDAYDAGRELAHIATARRYDECASMTAHIPPADPMCNERGIPESECPAYCLHGSSSTSGSQESDLRRPMYACGYIDQEDGCCTHPLNPTPECHQGVVCPVLAYRLSSGSQEES